MVKSGMERFNSRYSKAKEDERVIHESAMKKQAEEDMYDALKEEGNIEEAAMVVSRDGMKLLGQMLNNSIEGTVERVLERKLTQLLTGIHKGIQEGIEGLHQNTIKQVEEKVEEVTQQVIKEAQIPVEINLSDMPPTDRAVNKIRDQLGFSREDPSLDLSGLDKLTMTTVDKEVAKKISVPKKEQEPTVSFKPVVLFKWSPVPEKLETKKLANANKDHFMKYCPIIVEYLENHEGKAVAFKEVEEYSLNTYNVSFGNKGSKFMDFVILKDSRVTRHSYGHYILKK